MSLPDGYSGLPPGKLATVVTCLEMRDPPPVTGVAPHAEWTIRRIARAEPAWFRRLFLQIGQDWLWFSRLRYDDEQLAAILHAPTTELYTLSIQAQDKGLLELNLETPSEVEITFFGLTPDTIGQGAGRYLMAHALHQAWSRQPTRVWLHTCTLDHPRALAFYQRSGFKPYQRALEIFDDPRQTGLLPREAAPHIPLL